MRSRGYEIRTATEQDARYIAQNLRELDREEVVASSGPDYEASVVSSFQRSEECFVAVADGIPFCIFGVGTGPHGGIPWMLATPTIYRFPKQLLREARPIVSLWLARYGVLSNYVDARNAPAIRWLQRLGFRMTPAAPFGVSGKPFHFFYMTRNV